MLYKEEYNVGQKKNDNAGDNSGNSRNGYTTKTVISDDNDTIEVQVPRDRNSTSEPVIIPKHEKRTPFFNDQIISMYSLGMSTRDIQRHHPSLLHLLSNKLYNLTSY
ncbi:transposase [Treponema maltophilum]|uniref:transposase n=1 Tax=Treponema maltophilum TaxID=51160 RepID=UPI003D8EE8D1